MMYSFADLMMSLDRCEHGRHAIDPCFGCPGGESTGNLLLPPGTHIGWIVRGSDRIVVPDPGARVGTGMSGVGRHLWSSPEAWVQPR